MNVFGITQIRFIWFRLNLAWTYYLALEKRLRKKFSFFSKSKMAACGQRSEITQIWPHKSDFCSAFGYGSSNLDNIWHGHTTWPKKQAWLRNFHFSQNPRWPAAVKGPKLAKFDPTNHISAPHLDPVHLIWTIFDMGILVDPRNKAADFFFHFSQNPKWPPPVNIKFRHNFGSKITFRPGKWIPFIRFVQN